MARALFIFLIAALIAGAVVWVVSFPGWVTADWLGYRFEAPVSLTLLGVFGFFIALHFLNRLIRAIAGGPGAWQKRFREWRAQRGMGALTQGFAAAAAGDAGVAHKEAARAGRLVKNGPLAQVLALEAAALEGRDDDVAALAPVMLSQPETELLGRRALFDLARKRKDRTGEIDQAEAAFGAHPAAGWAAEALLADAIRASDWERAQSVVTRAARHDAFPNGRAKTLRAVATLAEARSTADAGDNGKAASLARKAQEQDPELVAAAITRADALAQGGKTKPAADIAQKSWKSHPHPDLGRHLAVRSETESGAENLLRARDAIAENSNHIESRLFLAERAILNSDVAAAREALTLAPGVDAPSRAYALLAALERAEHGAAADPDQWIAKALAARRDAVWRCGSCGYDTRDWHAVCPNCDTVGGARWGTHELQAEDARELTDKALRTPQAQASLATAEALPSDKSGEPARQPDDPGTDKKPAKDREW